MMHKRCEKDIKVNFPYGKNSKPRFRLHNCSK